MQEMMRSNMEERFMIDRGDMEERGEKELLQRREDYYEGFAEIDGSSQVLRMKMDAMTWAAKAKDAELAALQAAIREGRDRERRLEAELAGLKARLERAELAEERLAAEIADLEADAFERARTHKRQVNELVGELREKQKQLVDARGQLRMHVGAGAGMNNNKNAGGSGKSKGVVNETPQRTPPRRSPSHYPRSPMRLTPPVKLSSSWWPWSRFCGEYYTASTFVEFEEKILKSSFLQKETLESQLHLSDARLSSDPKQGS
ncbi:hypothetical protein GOP47_0008336 [Adiantum capillus-veneris]|uniref:Uncharacterized protein n=1 Tax=Adiantum capillus-veneris TaxID=13818 RepID=A0A9D4ZKC4_ADICA|nr:hypothetical protein GOP47_0008336 [Adiantum capillus-veneris]